MAYVIACGDEGVQINQGTRLGVVGAGFRLEGFSEVVKLFKTLFDSDLVIAASAENDWLKEKLSLSNWEQVDASSQQHIEAVADIEGLLYAGFLPFTDPKVLKGEIKGHMVRPHNVHIANKICFTLGGGEQVYNLGQYVISADWVASAPEELVKKFIGEQITFYTKLSGGKPLTTVAETAGVLGEITAQKNAAVLSKLGFIS